MKLRLTPRWRLLTQLLVLPQYASQLKIVFLLLIAGVGVKAAIAPLHGWVPQAMVAPAPVSALLHAVAAVKAGAFGIVRIEYEVHGIEFAQSLELLCPWQSSRPSPSSGAAYAHWSRMTGKGGWRSPR